MIKLYFFYVYACIVGLFRLKDTADFLSYSAKKGKNHRRSIKEYKSKIRLAKRTEEGPKLEHVYLWLLYSAINEDDPIERSEEFQMLLPITVAYWYRLRNEPIEKESMEQETE